MWHRPRQPNGVAAQIAARRCPGSRAAEALIWPLREAFAKSGIPAIGPRLWVIVQEAGLRPLGMIGIQPHFGPEDPVAVALLAGVISTAAPLIEATGVATAEEIGVETYAEESGGTRSSHLAQRVGNDRWSVTLATAHRAGLALRQEQTAPPWPGLPRLRRSADGSSGQL
jgi:hypothetical protein